MNRKYNWLELAEFFSIGSFFFGVISTAITKQILFSLIPLSLVILFNIINRQRHGYQKDKILEQKQEIQDLQQQLINFTDEYKAQKLTFESSIDDVNSQRLEEENKTQELINSIREEVKKNELEQEKQTQELHHNQFSQIEAIINSLESRVKDIENMEIEETKQQLLDDYNYHKLELIKLMEDNKKQVLIEYNSHKLELEKLIEEAKTQKLDLHKQREELERKTGDYTDDYDSKKEELIKLIEEGRIQIFNDYSYQKLELEKLIEKTNKQKLEQENKTNEYINIIEEAKKQIFKLHKELENVENDIGIDINDIGIEMNNFFENIKKNNNSTEFTEYYPLEGLKPFCRQNKWGYKDSNDNIVIKPTFDYAWDFDGNLAKVKKEVWGSYKYGLINSQGDIVLPIEYYSIEPFCEGMARITQESWGNYKYGFINDEGNLVIPIEYDYAESFNNGLAKVKKKNRSFYIDKKGNKVD